MAEWSRLDQGHVERVNNLQLGAGLNGAYVLSNDTVVDPVPAIRERGDSLSGESGRDWFLVGAGDSTDRVPVESLAGIFQ